MFARDHSNELESSIREGDNPVEEGHEQADWHPEYHETREILWEAGETTLQG
jgi:hypothetical protein